MSVMKLTPTGWKTFKKKHNLEKDPIIKKAKIDGILRKFQQAADECQDAPGEKAFMKVFSCIDKLKAIFKKLVKQSEGSQMPEAAKKQLTDWKVELKMISVSLAKLYAKSKDGLKAQDAKRMKKDFNEWGF
ncbi:MAG: hypothetical protein MUC83_10275 [Pirellula sp.]|jgi:hypothetical protein|nr:hypothetical protein [Pirellula sp.]